MWLECDPRKDHDTPDKYVGQISRSDDTVDETEYLELPCHVAESSNTAARVEECVRYYALYLAAISMLKT